MNENPRNCRNNCPLQNTTDCPAIAFEQTEHLHGFSQLVITVSQVIGCTAYPEPTNQMEEPVAEPQPAIKSPVSSKKKR